MNEPALKEIKKEDLQYALGIADSILSKNYLANLSNCEVVNNLKSESVDSLKDKLNSSVRFFDISQVILNKKENMRDKLATVFNAVGNTGASLLMQIKGEKNKVEIRIGVKNPNGDVQKTKNAKDILENSLLSNFPGIKVSEHYKEIDINNNEVTKNVLEKVLNDFSAKKTIAAVTDIAGLRSEEESEEKKFVQGIEKLIDAMRGKEYTLLLIADPISLTDLNENRRALENIYTQLVPFSSSQYSIGENESEGVNESISIGASDTITKSLAKSVNHTIGKSFSETEGTGRSETNGTSITETDGTNSSKSTGFNISAIVVGANHSRTSGKSHSVSKGTNHSVTNSENHQISHGLNESDSEGTTTSEAEAHAENINLQTGKQKQIGESKNIQIPFENHTVKRIMERIDKILERYDNCADLGMWNCAMYCISDEWTAQMAASVYRSLIRGKNSSLESSFITVWTPESNKTPAISVSLRHFEHPKIMYGNLILTPGTLISSTELAIEAGLPNHSLPGLPVIECAEFGRSVSSYDKPESGEKYRVHLGNIYYMHSEEELPVKLNPKSLASHTFITGSTGAGKSNTVYQVLDELKKIGVKFLVVEPAKGEYKNIFGTNADVSVYGTNPELMPLLRINPFSFPNRNADSYKNVHILEHLDRLVEIFNVCWPMYAAMPAVLKEAIEKSYIDCGWNLTESTNAYGTDLYPTFADVTRNIRTIIDSSEYDAENKGAYKGSLITRLKSLTNGINGLIFTDKEIEAEDLFDKNVIVDLSRVGSAETKSLIMGLLVLKLQEHRMTQGGMNSDLRHVTVLEEAHNLLKKTSTEQAQDSGNLQGKSVEMLTNSIAEMRTYGEGFIIADQAPALLDMAVIRNTNTKIIMRLPDQDDRELVGKAANLNNDQIAELAKLPRGVAAVYQNEWVEPVLCKVRHFEDDKKIYSYKHPEKEIKEDFLSEKIEIASLLFNGLAITDEVRLRELKEKLWKLDLRGSTKVLILNAVKTPLESPRYTKLSPVISEFFPKVHSVFVSTFSRTSDNEQWSIDVDNAIREYVKSDIEEELLRSIRQCIITDYIHNELGKTELLEKWSLEGGAK
ncbi:ATP-binding protein [Treponema sp. UBA6852]|uniref:ATP-binding protein n=1 Tax=Treponema sp. UBA6852 TaxID=1947744 RepID=UPI0025D4032D|nr:ATP-binding protein [Treponema sp. UBA6852]